MDGIKADNGAKGWHLAPKDGSKTREIDISRCDACSEFDNAMFAVSVVLCRVFSCCLRGFAEVTLKCLHVSPLDVQKVISRSGAEHRYQWWSGTLTRARRNKRGR